MDALRFIHQFFHFELNALERALAGRSCDMNFAQSLFSRPLLPRRELKKPFPRTFSEAEEVHANLLREDEVLGIRAVRYDSPLYPAAIHSYIPPHRRPALLYIRGQDVPNEEDLVGIVGTRKPSTTGMDAARSFSAYLGAIGLRVVSGLARGIDTAAHEESLEFGTIAVLGAGVSSVYPEENQALADAILAKNGTLLSPFPSDQVPLPQNFPDRNEVIAALSAGIIVIEGAEKSGAAITGRHALAMGKGVVALTQEFRSAFGRGAIRLQQEGAELAASEEEAVEAIFRRLGGCGSPLPPVLTPGRRKTFTFSQFQSAVKRPLPEALALLQEGILEGRIERLGTRYRLR